jgi:hypothetical protein
LVKLDMRYLYGPKKHRYWYYRRNGRFIPITSPEKLDRRRALPDRAQQTEREAPANDRGDLQDPLRIVGKPVDASHDDIVDRVGDRASEAALVGLAGVEGKLLEKQRVAVGLGDDRFRDRLVEPC